MGALSSECWDEADCLPYSLAVITRIASYSYGQKIRDFYFYVLFEISFLICFLVHTDTLTKVDCQKNIFLKGVQYLLESNS